ncbi:hypothetical protein I3843_04G024800 [Carya illinoinensis]|uniref:Protein kinase domain-containing protein n=1 Tax=Carya illinoinensis TaxID=32201 RepID=A0A922F4I6_CARIL|nr:hypothetical protein I3760_04G024800 [Carya illinoinensis]KAG6716014.1 hypothetical protein I3842_04G026000 [Carya illinoinensis]KAG7981959.1 hypothetical protein I3843_04G024800 [Carya illinoinensis]
MESVSEKRFPVNAKDYKLYEEVGEGVSASVYRALCVPLNEIVAIKVLDLEKCNNDLDGIRREVHTMSLIDHPNVLRAHCSFTSGHSLWVVMPYMSGGSCLHIMKSGYPEGFEEPVIATLLREVLKALVYLHHHGYIHRDVKAGNILIDSNGAVKLADFGVSAGMFDTGDRQRSRNTFVGTPCWMAPEVMQQLHGYDFKADIWSFGITALELAHGHAPFSKYPPMKVLLMTLQNAPPGLDYERDKKFSKSFKEMVATCLVKDPKKRPPSEKLLKHHFFKQARPNEYLAHTILDGLAPLGDRFRTLKAKEADLLVQNKALYGDKEHLSQQEYIRGISAWNFNLEDLKTQAALHCMVSRFRMMACQMLKIRMLVRSKKTGMMMSCSKLRDSPRKGSATKTLHLIMRGCFDVCEDDEIVSSPVAVDQRNGRREGESSEQSFLLPRHVIAEHKKFLSGSLLQENSLSPKRFLGDGDRDYLQPKFQADRNYSGSLLYRQKKDANNISSGEDSSEGAVVQRKGRFKVTSADLSPKGPTSCIFSPVSGCSANPTSPSLTSASILPFLQCILQQNAMQREELIKLIKYVEQTSGKQAESAEAVPSDLLQMPPATAREKELQFQVNHLQRSVESLVEELRRHKMKNAQLEKQLNALANREKIRKEDEAL